MKVLSSDGFGFRKFGILGKSGKSLGQANILQFVLFFIVGLALFVAIGNLFRFQYEMMRSDISVHSVEMINSYLSSAVVMSVVSCKQCDVVENKLTISDTTFGYFIETILDETGLSVSTIPDNIEHNSSINKLNESITTLEGEALSVQPINLTYDRNQNKLEIR